VLFQHNVETLLWQRQAAHEPSLVRRLLFRVEAAKMQRYERAALRRFEHIIAVSPHDREAMSDAIPADRITVVPTGVDLEQFRGYAGRDAGTDNVVFLGSMDWEANIDGAEYFCREIWPDMLRRVPTARFQIVGRNPAPRVQRLASESVEITGSVPSVVPYLASAAVFVVPLRIGGGTRLKIFEGMAMGRAVVSSSVGAEGLNVTHGRDALLADTPSAFSDAVVDLLTNPMQRHALGAAAAQLAARYDWSSVVGSFEEALRRARTTRPKAGFAIAGATA
jgi:glycosyltransferase involved in cell wall biosynthesis